MNQSRIGLREAGSEDAAAIAGLHVTTFAESHGRGPPYELRLGQWRDFFHSCGGPRFCYVAEDARGQPIGFARGIPYAEDDPPGFSGELNKIYVLRRHHRVGVGRRLVEAVAERFLNEGIVSMLLFGEARSPANGFYERLGGERLVGPIGEFHGAYGWRDLHALVRKRSTNDLVSRT